LFRQYGKVVNHKKVLRLMQILGLKAIIRGKRAYRSTYRAAESDGRVAENLLKRDFTAEKPNVKIKRKFLKKIKRKFPSKRKRILKCLLGGNIDKTTHLCCSHP
ncbi:transposase, partial [Brevibacillus sp. MCWH]|nr:transposase [Brevibacillus sp. MCWH]